MQKSRLQILMLFLLVAEPSMGQGTINMEGFTYGPYDYTNPEHFRDKLPIVEQYHFTSGIESLTKSIDDGAIGAHIIYTIRHFPNHHRALIAVTRLWKEQGSPGRPPPGVAPDQTPDYLYRRAIDFAPNDGTVRLLYGIYLLDAGREGQAVEMFDSAARLAPDSADINYNLGLMYLRVRDSEKADFHASKAYEMGHPLPGLRRKMVSAGIWQNQDVATRE